MKWIRRHAIALGVLAVSLVTLGGALWFSAIKPVLDQVAAVSIATDDEVSIGPLEITSITLHDVPESSLPDATVMLKLTVEHAMPSLSAADMGQCAAVILVEAGDPQRLYRPVDDSDLLAGIDAYGSSCAGSFDTAPGRSMLYFIVPADHGELSVRFALFGEASVQVALST